MSIDAIALLRIPDWEPPEELDVRELDDGLLVFLDIPFDADPDAILDALEAAVGDEMYEHEDERGIFILPDAAEPDDAETYEAVITAVGETGEWLPLDGALDVGDAPNPEAMFGQLLEAIGGGSAADIVRALQSGDEDALKLAQIQMTSAMERAVKGEPEGGENKG